MSDTKDAFLDAPKQNENRFDRYNAETSAPEADAGGGNGIIEAIKSDPMVRDSLDCIIDGAYTVLLVDDDKGARDALSASFTELGFNVITAKDGSDALGKYRKNSEVVEFVLTDALMPELDGFSLARGLREIDADLPVWMIAADPGDRKTGEELEAGIRGYIEKDDGADIAVILPRIKSHIREYRAVRKKRFHQGVEDAEEKRRIDILASRLSAPYLPRKLEDHGIAGDNEAYRYAKGVSYPENSDYKFMAMELELQFGLEGKRVIELGSGPGDLTRVIGESGAEYAVGIDGSEFMVDFATRKHAMPGVEYKLLNLLTMHADEPGLTASADIVVCQNSMHHFDGDSLYEFFKVGIECLKEDGVLYVGDLRRENLNREELAQRLIATNKHVREDLAHSIEASLTKQEIEEVLSRFGKEISFEIFYPDRLHDQLQKDPRYKDYVAEDPHPHYMDYDLSLRVVVRKNPGYSAE